MIGIEEASSKRTFLFRIPHGPADLARIDKQLSDLKVPLSHQRIRASNPVPVPKVVYAINTPEELRIKWTEQHKRVIAVRKTRSWDEKNIPKIIVLIVNTVSYTHLDVYKRQDVQHGIPQSIGRGGEDVMEFLMGDEALKGLALSQRLLKASKYAQMIEESPMLTHVFNAGVRTIRGTAVGAAQGAVKSGGNLTDAGEAGIGAGLANLVLPEVGMAAKAAPRFAGAVSDAVRGADKVVQPELQGSIRQILSDVAADHGITCLLYTSRCV